MSIIVFAEHDKGTFKKSTFDSRGNLCREKILQYLNYSKFAK